MTVKLLLVSLLSCFLSLNVLAEKKPTPNDVAQKMQVVADWQIAHFRDQFSNFDHPHHIRDWTNGAFYVGMMKWVDVTNDKRYVEWLKSVADKGQWQLHDRTYMADDHTVGQLYLELYRRYGDTAMIEPTRARLDHIMAHPSEESIAIGSNYVNLERWTWCDALFMAPPVWAKMSKITGDSRYKDWMMSEVKATVDHLFDESEFLFFRDNNFKERRVNDKKVFWARGNGWVFAGLTLIMNELPEDSADYAYLLRIYKKMADKLIAIQTSEGHWAMSLVNAENYPTPETSGTSFFSYGLAWGVNRGILKDEKYTQAIYKAWNALSEYITKEGMLGYVQPIGAAPGQAWSDKTETYGSGAFLAAGSEIFTLVGGVAPAKIPKSKILKNAIKATNTKLEAEIDHASNPALPKVFARYVPERKDDFAWENDLVAFRAYGPALREGNENAGIDCWPKRVKYPIINKWYALDIKHGISYHQDHGEGVDNYHVGSSAGCGGSALWLNGKREPLETYTRWSIQDTGADFIAFALTYHKEINGDQYREEKRFKIKFGSRMTLIESTFWKNGKLAANLPVAIGVTTHDDKANAVFDKQAGWLAAWENIEGFGFGTGVVVNPALITQQVLLQNSVVTDSGHALFIVNTNEQGKITYATGYGWEKAGDITTPVKWQAYLQQYLQEIFF